jgi:serine/threonine protein kinase
MLYCSKYEYKGRRWKRISKAGKAFIDDLLVVDPDDRATDDEALKASWLNRRYSATIRNPIMEEMNLAKDSVLRYAKYSKIRQMALMGKTPEALRHICITVPPLILLLHFSNRTHSGFTCSHCTQINQCRNWYTS